jgi:hypothetical protein
MRLREYILFKKLLLNLFSVGLKITEEFENTQAGDSGIVKTNGV